MDFSAQQIANRYLNEFILRGDRDSIPELSEHDILNMKIEKMATYADYVTKSMHLKESEYIWNLFCENQLDAVYDSEVKNVYDIVFDMEPLGICNYAYAALHCPAYLRKQYKFVLDAVVNRIKDRAFKATMFYKVRQAMADLFVIGFFVFIVYRMFY